MTVAFFVFAAAFVCAIAEALGKCPSWVPTVLLAIGGLLACMPIR